MKIIHDHHTGTKRPEEAQNPTQVRLVVQPARQGRDRHHKAKVEEELQPGRGSLLRALLARQVAQHLRTHKTLRKPLLLGDRVRLGSLAHGDDTVSETSRSSIMKRSDSADPVLPIITVDLPPVTFVPLYIRHQDRASPERLVLRHRPSTARRPPKRLRRSGSQSTPGRSRNRR